MEVNFQNHYCSCLHPVVREVQNSEQTQEIKLTEGMPDVGRILAAWGQPILRSKEWGTDTLNYTGGMMVWVLYAPEDGSPERCLDGWIPFQLRWDLPEDLPEGRIRMRLLPRLVDARSVSPRKILVRGGLSVFTEAFVPVQIPLFLPESVPEGVELLKRTYPVRLTKEAGEKTFALDEELLLPDSAPQPEQLVYYRVDPRVTDRKVLSEKVVFRGNAGVHLLYRSQEGQLHGWDFELPFSQFAELSGEYGAEAQAEFALCPTSLELELDAQGHMRLKCGMTAQFTISDRELLELVEDGYSPNRELTLHTQTITLPVILENRRETMYAEQTMPAEANLVIDAGFLPDFPRQRQGENRVELEQQGVFQVLYDGADGAIQAGTARWDGTMPVPADGNTDISSIPVPAMPQTAIGSSQLSMKAELPVELTSTARQQLSVVTGLVLGDVRKPDPGRPSLILRRAGEDSLWEIAKTSHSTVNSIWEANGLQAEPAPGQLLLIPIP